MKKLRVLSVLLIILLLQGCGLNAPKYIHFGTKNDPALYTKEIYTKLLDKEEFTMILFDNNLYKDIFIDSSENDIIKNFIDSLSDNDYGNEEVPTETEPFEIRIEFNDGSKYVINVFNDKLVTIYPWDGNYPEDVICMKNVPIHYNLYDFCLHIQKENKSFK